MTPLKNIGRTRAIEGHVLNENLWPKLQLDVLGYKVLLQNILKTFILRIFSCYLPNWMKNFTPSRLFLSSPIECVAFERLELLRTQISGRRRRRASKLS